MLLSPPIPFLRRRSPRTLELLLVSASYDVASSITLKFNRTIDIAQIQGPEIAVNDFINSFTFIGLDGPATLVDPFTIRIELEEDAPYAGGQTIFNASDDTRIRAIPGPQSWAGVAGLVLPFL